MLYSGSSSNNLIKFFSKQQIFSYKKGEVIIRVSEEPLNVYCIEKGYIKTYSVTESGEENFLQIFKPQDIFPVIWTFSGQNSEIFYETITPAELRKTSRAEFLDYLRTDPDAMFYLLKYITETFYKFFERMKNLGLTNSYPRIITRLIFLAKYFGLNKNGKIIFDFPISQKDISNSINVSRETASKELNTLARKGLIKNNGKSQLVINNLRDLEKELLLYYRKKS